jgi:hypothetical protein
MLDTSEAVIRDLLHRLAAAPLFAHVGKPVDDPSIQTVGSWKACLKSMNGRTWVNLGTRMTNRVFSCARTSRGVEWAPREWNAMATAQREAIIQTIGPALRTVMDRNDLPIEFQYFIVGDVLTAVQLELFKDAASKVWSDLTIRWLLNGHVPCGITGKLPSDDAPNYDALPVPSAANKLIVF